MRGDGLAQPIRALMSHGRGRATENVFIERLWRTENCEEIYRKEYSSGVETNHGPNDAVRSNVTYDAQDRVKEFIDGPGNPVGKQNYDKLASRQATVFDAINVDRIATVMILRPLTNSGLLTSVPSDGSR